MPPRTGGGRHALMWLLRLLGILVAAGLVWWTIRSAGADFGLALASSRKTPLVLAFLLYGVVQLMGAWRWQILLHGLDIPLSYWETLRLTLLGGFFSVLVPGSVSGDLAKMALVMTKAPNKRTEAVLSIAVDRFLGLWGLLLVGMLTALMAWFCYPELFRQVWLLRLVTAGICCASLGMGGLACVAAQRRLLLAWSPLARFSGWLENHLPTAVTSALQRLGQGVDLYRDRKNAVGAALFLAGGIHLVLGVETFLLGRALHEHAMSLLQYLTVAPIGNASGIIPLTPGGVGVRDAVTATFLEAFQATPPEVMGLIPVTYSMILVIWGGIGACLGLGGKKHVG